MSCKEILKERFLRYVSYDTQSSNDSESYPSTEKQLRLMEHLAEELQRVGAEDVTQDKYGYVMATLPASEGCELRPTIALIAHVDTSPDVSGADVKPQIIENYAGGDIELNHSETISIAEYPELEKLVGHTLITTDGTTLLGADDKAGVAEIVTAIEVLINNPALKHGRVRVCFTPDEEVGRGVDFLDLRSLGADFAYTLDGGAEGELEYENFNAAGAKIEIVGHNHHPGSAKGRMRNALDMAHELHAMLPSVERPQYTSGYEGFYHLIALSGSVEKAEMEYIIRDHSQDEFERKKVTMWSIVDFLQKRYGESAFKLTLRDQYFNMKRHIEPHPELIAKAVEAMKDVGVEPNIVPIRGGTDGSRLSFMGLPCPNLFTGGANFHSRYEYCSLTTMERAVEVIIKLLEKWSK